MHELLEAGERERAAFARLRNQAIPADMGAGGVAQRKPQPFSDDLSGQDGLARMIPSPSVYSLRGVFKLTLTFLRCLKLSGIPKGQVHDGRVLRQRAAAVSVRVRGPKSMPWRIAHLYM